MFFCKLLQKNIKLNSGEIKHSHKHSKVEIFFIDLIKKVTLVSDNDKILRKKITLIRLKFSPSRNKKTVTDFFILIK